MLQFHLFDLTCEEFIKLPFFFFSDASDVNLNFPCAMLLSVISSSASCDFWSHAGFKKTKWQNIKSHFKGLYIHICIGRCEHWMLLSHFARISIIWLRPWEVKMPLCIHTYLNLAVDLMIGAETKWNSQWRIKHFLSFNWKHDYWKLLLLRHEEFEN